MLRDGRPGGTRLACLTWFGGQAIAILTVNLNRYPGLEATSQQHMAWLSIPRPEEMPRAVLTSAPLQDTTGADMSVKSSCISAGVQGRKPNGFPVRSVRSSPGGHFCQHPASQLFLGRSSHCAHLASDSETNG